jgi:hypothetical protein
MPPPPPELELELLELELLLEPLELPELLLLLELELELELEEELLPELEEDPLLELELEPLALPELLLVPDDEALPELDELEDPPPRPPLELVLLLLVPDDDPELLELPWALPPTHTLIGVSVPPVSCTQVCPDGQGFDESHQETHVPLTHVRLCPHGASPCVAVQDVPAAPGPLAMHA